MIPWPFSEERLSFQQMVLRQQDNHIQKTEVGPLQSSQLWATVVKCLAQPPTRGLLTDSFGVLRALTLVLSWPHCIRALREQEITLEPGAERAGLGLDSDLPGSPLVRTTMGLHAELSPENRLPRVKGLPSVPHFRNVPPPPESTTQWTSLQLRNAGGHQSVRQTLVLTYKICKNSLNVHHRTKKKG